MAKTTEYPLKSGERLFSSYIMRRNATNTQIVYKVWGHNAKRKQYFVFVSHEVHGEFNRQDESWHNYRDTAEQEFYR